MTATAAEPLLVAGIDVGSSAVKIALLRDAGTGRALDRAWLDRGLDRGLDSGRSWWKPARLSVPARGRLDRNPTPSETEIRAEVVFTSASWRRTQVASVCPTSGSSTYRAMKSVDVTSEVLDYAKTTEVRATWISLQLVPPLIGGGELCTELTIRLRTHDTPSCAPRVRWAIHQGAATTRLTHRKVLSQQSNL